MKAETSTEKTKKLLGFRFLGLMLLFKVRFYKPFGLPTEDKTVLKCALYKLFCLSDNYREQP